MPLDEDGRSGSGYDPKTRLDLPVITGDLDAPLSRREMSDLMRQVKEWSQRLQFGRVGFTVQMLPLTAIPLVTNEIAVFNRLIEDSHSFHLTYLDDPLSIFQVPPGMGRVYNISYSMDFAVLQTVTDSFTANGSIQEWTAPAGLLGNRITVEARGGEGNGPGGAFVPGKGAVVGATFNGISPGEVFDVYLGLDGGLGGVQTATGSDGKAGGGSAQLRPDGGSISTAMIVAGGGGGTGGGSLAPQATNGGDGNWLVGGSGTGYSQGIPPGNATGGTQSAGGIGGFLGEDGDTDGQGFGGDAPDTSGTTFPGGGGGGGWHGGGSGSFVTMAHLGGGGGGGSSKVQGGGTNITHTDGANTGLADLDISYIEATAAASTDVITRVWVAYAQWPDKAPYEHVVQVAGDSGASPQNASISLPLGEGDRIWMTYDNAEAAMGIVNWNFTMYAQGM